MSGTSGMAAIAAELAEARAYQQALTDVLAATARAGGNATLVLETIAAAAVRLCQSDRALIYQLRDGLHHLSASCNAAPDVVAWLQAHPIAQTRGSIIARAVLDKRSVHVPDVLDDREFQGHDVQKVARGRTILGVPLLHKGEPIGSIALTNHDVRPFTPRQIALVETFADQAVIAIENARLFEAERERTKELAESLEYQTATSEVLAVISKSPNDLQKVLDAIVETAARLCEADRVNVRQREGEAYVLAAMHGYSSREEAFVRQDGNTHMPLTMRRAIETRKTHHTPDIQAREHLVPQDGADAWPEAAEALKGRTGLCVPFLRDGELIGALLLVRREYRPFSQKQMTFAETFARQAVIAIENARLFEAEATRTKELRESLEYQTATSEVLGVISRSPNDLQPVLDTLVASAQRLCVAEDAIIYVRDGNVVIGRAHVGRLPWWHDIRQPLNRSWVTGRAVLDGKTVHVPDFEATEEFPEGKAMALRTGTGNRAALASPLMRDGVAIGAILMRRLAPRPFTERQIQLLESFADQAVIAMNNARLFEAVQARTREVTETLEYQTAITDVLGVISRSKFDLAPVLQSVADTAIRLCRASQAIFYRLTDDGYRFAAGGSNDPEFINYWKNQALVPGMGTVVGRAALLKQAVSIPDALADPDYARKEQVSQSRARSLLGVPLLRDGVVIGVISLWRAEVDPFSKREIELVQTFAEQAVIAISNTELFEQVEARTKEVSEALEYQTATSEVLAVISKSPDAIQPVLEAIAATSRRLCDAQDAFVLLRDQETLRIGAHDGLLSVDFDRRPLNRDWVAGRTVVDSRAIHVPDLHAESAEYPMGADFAERFGHRTSLGIPLLRDGRAVGCIFLTRLEVWPFSERQITLLRTFADQAVIAINNVGNFEQVQARTKEVTEALEYQTATSEVLGVISSSPNELQPVFDAIVATARRLCDAEWATIVKRSADGSLPLAAHNGLAPEFIEWLQTNPAHVGDGSAVGIAAADKRTLHLPDALADPRFTDLKRQQHTNARTRLAVPLLNAGEVIGVIFLAHTAVKPFTDRQIELVTTFANQAVIAVNNVGNFEQVQARTKEVTEALEYQTATSELLGVISRSPNELQPVLDSIAETAQRLCQADYVGIFRPEGAHFRLVAIKGSSPELADFLSVNPLSAGSSSLAGRCVLAKRPLHVHDQLHDPIHLPNAQAAASNLRTVLSIPLMRDSEAIGVVQLGRNKVEPFTQRQIDLVTTFADQAVIAINNVGNFEQVQARTKELTEALEYQTATSEVLSVISSSPNELSPVLEAILDTALRLCRSTYGHVRLLHEDGAYHISAHRIPDPGLLAAMRENPFRPGLDSVAGRAALQGVPVHVADVAADAEIAGFQRAIADKVRTALSVPLKRNGVVVGLISLWHPQVRPFTQRQIDLVTTFADQAVIAMNNARLFEEVQARTKEVTEALEYQTATSEVLGVISRSPNELQPVLDAIVETAVRLCGSDRGTVMLLRDDAYHLVAWVNPDPAVLAHLQASPLRPGRETITGRVALEGSTVHIDNTHGDAEFLKDGPLTSQRSMLGVPLLRGGRVAGVLVLSNRDVKPFTAKQIAMVETFADQAVIAMNNARLFEEVQARTKEVTEALEYQTATSEVLSVISRSPNDLQPVLDTIVETAHDLCQAEYALFLKRGDAGRFDIAASKNADPAFVAWLTSHPVVAGDGSTVGMVAADKRTIHLPDALADPRFTESDRPHRSAARTRLGVPLLQAGEVIGIIFLARYEMKPFSDRQIDLVTTFASQAVIAINNVGNFEQVQARTKEVTEALEYQTATSEVLDVISRSPNELQPVLDAIVHTAQTLCKAEHAFITRLQDGLFHTVAASNATPEWLESLSKTPLPPGRGSVTGRVALARHPIHIHDVATDPEYTLLDSRRIGNVRTNLGVPLIKDGIVIGVIILGRTQVRPFSQRQIDLIETFADQAVIAINNVAAFHEIQEKSRQLEIASQHKSQFLANMSHELRTPLNAILGYTELIQDGIYGEAPAKIKGVVDRVSSNGKHLLGLINDVLDFSKIEAGELKLQIADYAVKHLIQTVATATEPLATAKKLKFTIEVGNDLPTGHADERRLAQVLLNLVGNAIKFTEAGSVTVAAVVEGANFHVRVIDTGPGIAAAEHTRIFEQFQQVDSTSTRTKGGTGLGLAITKRFVEMHGGRIWVESIVGQGATFHVVLPILCRDGVGGTPGA